MQWNLEVSIDQKPSFQKIAHEDRLLSIGSCFSEHMADKMAARGIRVVQNPFGILYNPMSIQRGLRRVLDGTAFTAADLQQHGGLWLSLDHHTAFSHPERDKALEMMNDALARAHDFAARASTAVITFGTAYYYTWHSDGRVVGNCHKMNVNHFQRKRAAIPEIVEAFNSLMDAFREKNPDLQWLFTVSPVRHWKDGAADNQWSKSILSCAVRELVEARDTAHYFPSYEIMMDELRDHRFYASDLLHPNAQAIDHIWERFERHCLTHAAQEAGKRIRQVVKRMEHRPMHPAAAAHAQFEAETDRLKRELLQEFPYAAVLQDNA